MVKKIIWTPGAEKTFDSVINYLKENWSGKAIEKFVAQTDRVIQGISVNPEMYRKSGKLNTREALITKHNLLVYFVKKDSIDLIIFWDTRQHPKKKLNLLK